MRYASIRKMDISNGEGIGIALFVQGCSRHCYNCFNPETWDFNGGKEWTDEVRQTFWNLMMDKHIQRVSVLGGEPLAAENVQTVTDLLKDCRNQRGNDIKIWLWTGCKFEDVKELEIMKYLDYLIDGEYIDSKRNLSLKFRGSSNQRLIDVQQSLEDNTVVLYDKEVSSDE